MSYPINRDFLNEDVLRFWCGQIKATPELSAVLADTAAAIRADERLVAIFRQEQQLHGPANQWFKGPGDLPVDDAVKAALPEPSLFYYLSYLSALPWTHDRYAERGMPEVVFAATIANLPFLIQHRYAATGRWFFTHFTWVWRYLAGVLYRLGRMNYQVIACPAGVRAFRHRSADRIAVLADPDLPLRSDGYANGAGGRNEPDPWQAIYRATESGWLGHPVSRQGQVARESISLPRAEWSPVLQPGDWVLDVHIPWNERFEPQDCQASLAMAEQFFRQYFPDQPYKGFYCHTWLFTVQLEQFLTAESNILRFQREFHLLPYPGNSNFLWSFVFPEGSTPENAPRDTRLRRAVLDHLQNGGELFEQQGIALQGAAGWGKA